MKIYNFKCETYTPFAPYWDYFVGEKISKLDYSDLKEEILRKEQDIISKFEYENDWGTGLGKRSLTARSNRYNLLNFENAGGLRTEIRYLHDEFLKSLDLEYKGKIYVQCWANVMRKNQKIKVHCHGFGPYQHLSGHLCIQVNEDLYPTNTNYYNPYGVKPWSSPNAAAARRCLWWRPGAPRCRGTSTRPRRRCSTKGAPRMRRRPRQQRQRRQRQQWQ